MSIELYEHNQTAYELAVSMLDKVGKAAVIHPTGTGKSFIGFKLCEDIKPDYTSYSSKLYVERWIWTWKMVSS